jgi:hypothetical protein
LFGFIADGVKSFEEKSYFFYICISRAESNDLLVLNSPKLGYINLEKRIKTTKILASTGLVFEKLSFVITKLKHFD